MEEYLIPAAHAEAELIEKKSRFIGAVYPVESEQEARACIEAVGRRRAAGHRRAADADGL